MTRSSIQPPSLRPRFGAVACAAALTGLLASCGGGEPGGAAPAQVVEPAGEAAAGKTDQELTDEVLAALGYAEFGDELEGPVESGVVTHVEGAVQPGLLFVCSRSRSMAMLLDLEGQVVFRWKHPDGLDSVGWYHVELLANGDLVVLEKGKRITCIAPDGSLVWQCPIFGHHDLYELEDGRIVVLESIGPIQDGIRVGTDNIVTLSPDGEVLSRVALLDLYRQFEDELPPERRLEAAIEDERARIAAAGVDDYDPRSTYLDYFHTNSIEPLGPNALAGEDSRFAAEHWLVCLRNLDSVLVVDLDDAEVLHRFGEQALDWPHHPTMQPDGTVLVYDNGATRGSTRVLQLHPLTGEVTWSWPATLDREVFFSSEMGSVDRLPNGNTLIADSIDGRVLEVDPGGRIVWEWLNPQVEDNRRESLYRVEKVPATVLETLRARATAND